MRRRRVGALLVALVALAAPAALWSKPSKKPKAKLAASASATAKAKPMPSPTLTPSPQAALRRSTLRILGGLTDSYASRGFERPAPTGVKGTITGTDLSKGTAAGATIRFARDTEIFGWTLDFRRSLQVAGGGEDAWIEMSQLGLGGEALWRFGRLDLLLGLGLASAQDRVWRAGASPKDYYGWSSLARGTAGLQIWLGPRAGHGLALGLHWETARGSSSFDADPGYEIRPSLLLLGLSMND